MIIGILETYLLICLVVIHLSLLFCDDTCVYNFSDYQQYLPPQLISYLLKMFSLIPVEIQLIQKVAQVLLIGDIAFIIVSAAKVVKSLVSQILYIVFLTLCIMFAIYLLAFFMQSPFANEMLSEAKLFLNNTYTKIQGHL